MMSTSFSDIFDPRSRQTKLIIPLLLSFALGACTTQTPSPDIAEIKPATQKVELLPEPFSRDTLYSLLVAEVAGRRGNFDIALNNYLEQAQQTRDLGLTKRAAQIARQLRAPKAALEASKLWVELDPENQEARFIAASEQVNAEQFLNALENSIKLEALGGQPLYLTIASRVSSTDHPSASALVERISIELEDQPENTGLIAAKGILLQRQAPEETLKLARQAQILDKDFITAAVMEVKSLQQLKRNHEAQTRLEALLEEHPDNKRLRLQYARLLASIDLASSKVQFENLHKQHPKDEELSLAYALVLYELKETKDAAAQFNLLLDSKNSTSMANYYLGRISMNQDQPNVALGYLADVTAGGPNYLPAWVFRSDILVKQGQTESAIELFKSSAKRYPKLGQRFLMVTIESLNKYQHAEQSIRLLNAELLKNPSDAKLLYARAMSYEKLDQLAEMEADLRDILASNPDDASILNTLGYTLATRSNRFNEAYQLIEKAYQLTPNDPAVIDSIGWIEYLRGNLEPALKYLRRAIKAFPDHEIAAHLGEVLWALERRDEARNAWRSGLDLRPNSPFVTEAMQRLNANF